MTVKLTPTQIKALRMMWKGAGNKWQTSHGIRRSTLDVLKQHGLAAQFADGRYYSTSAGNNWLADNGYIREDRLGIWHSTAKDNYE